MKDSQQDGRRRSRGILQRSGLVTALILAVALGILGLVWAAHVHGRIHKLTQLTSTPIPPEAGPPARPGGQEAIRLDRIPRAESMEPEFTSATFLPGLGLEMLQASLQLPGHTATPLLLATADADLGNSSKPQASPFFVTTDDSQGEVELVRDVAARESKSDVLPDGSAVTAQFPGDVTSSHGAAIHTGVQTKITTILSGRGLDLILSAKNTGDTPRGLTLGWRTNFLAPRAGLRAMTVEPPSTQQAGVSAEERSDAVRPARLPAAGIDRTFSNLKHNYLSTGPELLLHNQEDGYTLHFTALTPSIRSLQLKAAADGKSLLMVFSTASGESRKEARTIVAPGETLEWKIRVSTTLESTYIPAGN